MSDPRLNAFLVSSTIGPASRTAPSAANLMHNTLPRGAHLLDAASVGRFFLARAVDAVLSVRSYSIVVLRMQVHVA
jgi:hypothetical protein